MYYGNCPLPSFLDGRITQAHYSRWLECNARRLFKRDKKRGRPYALKGSGAVYKSLIHLAVVNGCRFDPYTGEELKWELISTRKAERIEDLPERFEAEYSLMPSVDHRDREVLDFEVCSLRVSLCKSGLTPDEFVAFCRRVAGHG